MARFLGIDPGSHGALCIYCPLATPASGMRWHFLDMPMVGKKSAARLNAPEVRDWLMKLTPERAVIELVNPMPGQGSVTTGIFIGVARAVEAVVAACDIPLRSETPSAWKNAMGVPKVPTIGGESRSVRTRKLKEASRNWAIRRFPELKDILAMVKSSDRAEAALIAAYAASLVR